MEQCATVGVKRTLAGGNEDISGWIELDLVLPGGRHVSHAFRDIPMRVAMAQCATVGLPRTMARGEVCWGGVSQAFSGV